MWYLKQNLIIFSPELAVGEEGKEGKIPFFKR